MKKLRCLLLCLATLTSVAVFAQSSEPAAPAPQGPHLTKFDLDFRGGTPRELVAAIQKATGKPLNLVIPDEFAEWKLPPLKMNGVDVSQLFRAMSLNSRTSEVVAIGNGSYSQRETAFNFVPADGGPSNDSTVWSFTVSGPARAPKVSRFYYLKPYLDGGLTVDDITTAIQTGWKMRGDATPPVLSFHKETKLLIAVGDLSGLDVIDQVLKALDAIKAKTKPELSDAEMQVLDAVKARPTDKSPGEPKTKP